MDAEQLEDRLGGEVSASAPPRRSWCRAWRAAGPGSWRTFGGLRLGVGHEVASACCASRSRYAYRPCEHGTLTGSICPCRTAPAGDRTNLLALLQVARPEDRGHRFDDGLASLFRCRLLEQVRERVAASYGRDLGLCVDRRSVASSSSSSSTVLWITVVFGASRGTAAGPSGRSTRDAASELARSLRRSQHPSRRWRAGFGVGEGLGRVGDVAVDLVRLKLDAVGLQHESAQHVDEAHADRLWRLGQDFFAADRRRVGIEPEGIEGGKIGGVFGGSVARPATMRRYGLMVMNSRVPCRSTTVSWITWRVAKPAEWSRCGRPSRPTALCPVVRERRAADRLRAARLAALHRAHHAGAVRHVRRGIDGDADEADAEAPATHVLASHFRRPLMPSGPVSQR